jgi:hypothetical protein
LLAQKNSDMRNNKREEQFKEFEACNGMPAKGTKLYKNDSIEQWTWWFGLID